MRRKNKWFSSVNRWIHGSDHRSGTVMGLLLIALAAVGLVVVASLGNILVCQSKARTAADSAALAAASALDEGYPLPSAQATTIAIANGGQVVSCNPLDDDVEVRVQVPTQVPFVPQVTVTAKAGPEDCS